VISTESISNKLTVGEIIVMRPSRRFQKYMKRKRKKEKEKGKKRIREGRMI